MSIPNWFMDGGIFMYFILIADLIAVVAVIILAIVKNQYSIKRLQLMMIGTALLPLLIGAFGFWVGYEQMMSALPLADPAEKDDLYNAAMSVVRIPAIFGGASAAVLFVMGFLGLKKY